MSVRKYLLVAVAFALISCEKEDNIVDSESVDHELDQDTVRFSDLRNLFRNQCYSCHSQANFSFTGLNLDSYENVMSGNMNGSVAIPFKPLESPLYTKCTPDFLENPSLVNGGSRMPEDNETFFDQYPEKLELIYDWIYFGCLE